MKETLLAAILLTTVASSARAQCAPATYETPPCLAGAWIGTNTAMQRMQQMLDAMPTRPSSMRDVFAEGFSEVLGMQVYPDGFYATIPIHRNVLIDDYTTINGDTIHVQTDMSLAITTAVGYLWATGNQLHFCAEPGSGQPTLLVESQSSHGGGGSTIVSPFGPPGFTPQIDFSCVGDSWNFTVHLPQPVGDIDYYLTRVPMSAFDDEYRHLVDSRFAPADGFDGAGDPLPEVTE